MAEHPAFPLWTDAYLGDTTHLSTIENGAYLLLLITAWRTKTGTLPDDDKLLARYARMTARQWARYGPTIREFFDVKDGQLVQGRLMDERDAVRRRVESSSNAGRASALKRKNRASTDVANPYQRNSNLTTTIQSNTVSESSTINDESNSDGVCLARAEIENEIETDAEFADRMMRDASAAPNTKIKPEGKPNGSGKRGSRISEDWNPSESDCQFALAHGIAERDVGRIADEFHDYWRAASGNYAVKRDWSATWRNRVREIEKRGGDRPERGGLLEAATRAAARLRDDG